MHPRTILMVSLLANFGLGIAAATLWLQRGTEPEPPGFTRVPVIDPAASRSWHAPNPATERERLPTSWEPFTWGQVESEDYREYMTNLRSLACPERLIRDLIVAELDDAYRARREWLRVELHQSLPPWAGADRREAMRNEYARQSRELEEEQWRVTTELLGFPWSRHAKNLCLEPDAILTGHVTIDQAIQAGSLLAMYRERLDWVHDRTRGVLLTEDRAELAALADELQARLQTVLGSDPCEELLLRILWTKGLAAEGRFEFTELTGAEVRQVVRLFSQQVGGIAGILDPYFEVSDAERAGRAAEFDRSVLEILGAEKAADLDRALDRRFHVVLDFAQEHRLPPHTAVAAYDIRVATEEEARRLRANTELGPTAIEARLTEIQAAALTALTQVVGPAHLRDYLDGVGRWLVALDANSVTETKVVP